MDGCKYGGGPKMAKKYDGKLYYIYIYIYQEIPRTH